MGEPAGAPATRLIAMGSAALTDGFRLIGVECHPDATPATLEGVLAELVRAGAKALVFVEHDLAREGGPWLARVRNEGGRIVVTEVPPLHAPGDYRPAADQVVAAILGPSALEERDER